MSEKSPARAPISASSTKVLGFGQWSAVGSSSTQQILRVKIIYSQAATRRVFMSNQKPILRNSRRMGLMIGPKRSSYADLALLDCVRIWLMN